MLDVMNQLDTFVIFVKLHARNMLRVYAITTSLSYFFHSYFTISLLYISTTYCNRKNVEKIKLQQSTYINTWL